MWGMNNKRLFERIREWPGKGKNPSFHSGNGVGSVVNHLKQLLNSRQGSTLIDRSYGMPDFTALRATFPDSIRDMERSITRTIERYEPRLKQVDVDFVEQDERDMTLYFHIHALLDSGQGETTAIYLESTLDAGGKMAVRG
jgi:type VI secretion system protein